MALAEHLSYESHIHPILSAVRAEGMPRKKHEEVAEGEKILPFITISRQAGAGAITLARQLVERLNEIETGEPAWKSWDRELIEKISAEHHIPEHLIQSIEEMPHSWMGEFLSGLSFGNGAEVPDEFKVYRRVAVTIRAIARVGRAVIVGRGGVFVTADMPGGVHLRLVAPLEYRVKHMAKFLNVSENRAAAEVRRADRNRAAFFRRHWPGKELSNEMFAMTLNTALIEEGRLADCIVPLVAAKRTEG